MILMAKSLSVPDDFRCGCRLRWTDRPQPADSSRRDTLPCRSYPFEFLGRYRRDGVRDDLDAFVLGPNEVLDTDGDGIGDNADKDDDGDGVEDAQDAFPFDSGEF